MAYFLNFGNKSKWYNLSLKIEKSKISWSSSFWWNQISWWVALKLTFFLQWPLMLQQSTFSCSHSCELHTTLWLLFSTWGTITMIVMAHSSMLYCHLAWLVVPPQLLLWYCSRIEITFHDSRKSLWSCSRIFISFADCGIIVIVAILRYHHDLFWGLWNHCDCFCGSQYRCNCFCNFQVRIKYHPNCIHHGMIAIAFVTCWIVAIAFLACSIIAITFVVGGIIVIIFTTHGIFAIAFADCMSRVCRLS